MVGVAEGVAQRAGPTLLFLLLFGDLYLDVPKSGEVLQVTCHSIVLLGLQKSIIPQLDLLFDAQALGPVSGLTV
jgi:hypothetical protein